MPVAVLKTSVSCMRDLFRDLFPEDSAKTASCGGQVGKECRHLSTALLNRTGSPDRLLA